MEAVPGERDREREEHDKIGGGGVEGVLRANFRVQEKAAVSILRAKTKREAYAKRTCFARRFA